MVIGDSGSVDVALDEHDGIIMRIEGGHVDVVRRDPVLRGGRVGVLRGVVDDDRVVVSPLGDVVVRICAAGDSGELHRALEQSEGEAGSDPAIVQHRSRSGEEGFHLESFRAADATAILPDHLPLRVARHARRFEKGQDDRGRFCSLVAAGGDSAEGTLEGGHRMVLLVLR